MNDNSKGKGKGEGEGNEPPLKPMRDETIRQIQVTFPCPVELPAKWVEQFVEAVDQICKNYERQNPSRVMWPFGVGSKPLYNWHAIADGEQEFDSSTLHIEVAEREDYKVTEAPSADSIRERASRAARRYWGYTNGGMISMHDIEYEVLTLVNEAYAVGLQDGKGSEIAKATRYAMRVQSPNTKADGNLLSLMILARRQALQKKDPSKVLVIQPGEFAEIQPGDKLSVALGSMNELMIKYTSIEEQKEQKEQFDGP